VPLVVETVPRTLVIGGGIAGLRAAIGLADIGLGVTLVERELELGGWVRRFGTMFPHDRNGRELIESLVAEVRRRPTITVLTGAEVVSKAGGFGNYEVSIRVGDEGSGTIEVMVGTIIVATGFDSYQPDTGEFGYGIEGVLTLPEFKELVDASTAGPLAYKGHPVRSLAYVYCVGSRETNGCSNQYCSRFCCASTVQTAVQVSGLDPSIRQFHLYRDMRTYGKFEPLYTEARKAGSVFMKFAQEAPPAVERRPDRGLTVTVTDTLTGGETLAIPVDLVVLVTGMVLRANQELVDILKLPFGSDGFFNEIHPKLRPVETVVDGVLIAGACQGPKTSSESVGSGLAAVTQSAAVLKKGFTELDPLVATVDAVACTACGDCLTTCPYDAISMAEEGDRHFAVVSPTGCKGCGGCVPVCPENAIDLLGYTDAQITAMIESLTEVPA
jgi:heterodisulfide reductase subunit A